MSRWLTETLGFSRVRCTLDFDFSVAEFAGSEWVEEQEECPTGAVGQVVGQVQRGLIPQFEPTVDHPRDSDEYVHPPVDRELLRESATGRMAPQAGVPEAPKTEMKFAKATHPKRAITGAKYFTSDAALDEQEESDP